MRTPLQITFRNFPRSDALEAMIVSKAEKLEEFYDRMVSCKVVIESPHRSHRQGNTFKVKVFIAVPNEEIVIGREPETKHAHEDPYVAVRDAFDAARRQLQDYVRRMPRRVHRHHERPPHGKVSRLLYDGQEGGYGFLQTEDGRELYFNSNSVLNGEFESLEVGTEVRYREEPGEDGPQASTVEVVGRESGHFAA